MTSPSGRAGFGLYDPDATAVEYGLFHGQWKLDRDGVAPHRPFGAGLGYTTWSVDAAGARVVPDGPGATTGEVHVEVVNTGPRPGATVLFCFAGLPGSAVDRPVRRLVAFERLSLGPGEATAQPLRYDLADLAVRRDGGWVQEPGRYELWVGTDAGTPVPVGAVDLPGAG